VPLRDWQTVALALRDADSVIVGGLYGATMWSWLMIDGLWVADAFRGQGLGRRLLLAAEELAVRRGCRGSWLGTFDFQARAFYERHGYAVFAELPGFPPGHTHFHLWKPLASVADEPPARDHKPTGVDSRVGPISIRKHS
jgi:ribosomal protein S18 acetylase RimI-like enzyme